MSLVGRAALLLALVAAIYASGAALDSRLPGPPWLGASAARGVYAVFGFTSLAIVTMWAALLTDAFELRNVAEYSSTTLGPRTSSRRCGGARPGRCCCGRGSSPASPPSSFSSTGTATAS